MNTEPIIQRKWRTLLCSYQAALRRYLGQCSVANLRPALRLGRHAVTLGLETLDLVLIHEQALLDQILPVNAATDRKRITRQANTFFAEAMIPLEETHRSALEANAHLLRLNKTLNQRTQDLALSNRKLRGEITRRQMVENTLRQSEHHSARLLEQSQLLQEQMRLLSHRILLVQEEERKRISRELHDVIAQMLTGINVRLATLKMDAAADTKGLSRKISRAQRLVEKSVDSVHRFARELRPAVLDDLGLIPALHTFMKSFSRETGIHIRFTTFTSGRVDELDTARRTVFYRIAQEALNNVARHAHASRVDVAIRKLPQVISLTIKDNGKSFQVERVLHIKRNSRLGLLGMRERVEMVGGKFSIESSPGKGTTIQAQIPFSNKAKERTRP